MSKSARLRLGDVRRAFRLVGECRDLGRNPDAWVAHLCVGIQRLVDARLVVGGVNAPGGRLDGRVMLHPAGVGFLSPAHRAAWAANLLANQHLEEVSYTRFRAAWRPRVAVRREQLIPRRVWHRLDEFNVTRRYHEVDDFVGLSVERSGGPGSLMLNVNRRLGGPAFTERERRLLYLTGLEASRLFGRRLAVGPDRLRADLPARLGPVLDALLTGDGEKQIAVKLGVSRHTVHEYVKLLYKRYEVNSRAELMALFAG